MPNLKSALSTWLPVAAATTALCGLVFVSVQQSLRQSANDPQIQMAEEAATALSRGASAESVLPSAQLDIARSLAPFTVVYDSRGTVIGSSGLLHGQSPHLPSGVLDNVRQHGESRLTLQPETGVRLASVITPYAGQTSGFVLAGRSLREVEFRTSQLRIFTLIAWFAALAVSLLIIFSCALWTSAH
jgi:hypothetical protein